MLEDFEQGLQQLIQQSLAKKTEEVKAREAIVIEREKKIEMVLKNLRKGRCEIQVGNCLFSTTCETLTRVEDSYFSLGLLSTMSLDTNGNFKEPVFIDRDGEVFKYILEYLQYGQIYTPPPNEGFLRKLIDDAKFYLLPELVIQLSEREIHGPEKIMVTPAYISLSSQNACGNQQIVIWNGVKPYYITPSHFTLSPDFTRITFVKGGLYQIHVRLGGTNSGNTQHLGLQVNGVEYAQCVQADGNGMQNSPQITEIISLLAGDYIQVRCGATGGSVNLALQTRLFILSLSKCV